MLGAGKSEWALSGGLASYFLDGERAYLPGSYLAGGVLRYGATDQLTLEAQAKGDTLVTEGGLGVLTATPWGSWGLHGAVSRGDTQLGYAANVNWDLVNIRGLFGTLREARESGAALRRVSQQTVPLSLARTSPPPTASSTGNRPIGSDSAARTPCRSPGAPRQLGRTLPICRPSADHALSLAGGRRPLWRRRDAVEPARQGIERQPDGRILQRVLSCAYQRASNRTRARSCASCRLFVRPDKKSRLSASYNSLNRASYASAYRGEGRGLDTWEADINLQNNDDERRAMANGSLAYSGNRARCASLQLELRGRRLAARRTSTRRSSAPRSYRNGNRLRRLPDRPRRANSWRRVATRLPHENLPARR